MPPKIPAVRNLPKILTLAILAASILPSARAADNPLAAPSPPPFAGTFSDATITLQLSVVPDGYTGSITQAGNKFPATATADDGPNLTGKFTANKNDFPFTATLENDHLILVTAGTTYKLVREVNRPLAKTPVNPLAAVGGEVTPAAPSTPSATATPDQPGAQTLADFTVLGSTATGQTLFLKLPNANSVETAVIETADQLAKTMDAKPTLSGGFADSKTKGRGGALLTDKIKGKDFRGWVFCAAASDGKGITATVVLAPTDAPKEDIETLFAYLPAKVKTQTYQFPDGSGSVELPEGWTTKQQSLTHGCAILGPAGQAVVMGNAVHVYTPTCNLIQMGQQNYKLAMQNYQFALNAYRQSLALKQRYPNIPLQREPVPPKAPDPEKDMPFQIFCPYCDGPEEVLKTFYPISERHAKNAGGPYSSLEKIISVTPAAPNPQIPHANAGICYLLVTDHDGQKTTTVRVLNRIDTFPIFDGKDSWVCRFNSMRAPDATFDRDLPVMNDIMNSFKFNMDVINKQWQQENDTIRKMGEDNERALLKRGKDFQKQQDEHFRRFEANEIAQENARHDSASDFIEMIRGVRDVYDNKTGEMHSVDLNNVNGIVNGMNDATNDPGRFVQIPLRYER